MSPRILVTTALAALVTTSGARAVAEQPTIPPPPPLGGPELAMGVGYARAFGVDAASAPSDAGGIGMDLALGLRRRTWTIALDTTHSELETAAGRRYLTTGAGLAVTFHLMPSAMYAPWIRTGIGYRYVKHGVVDAHGLQLGHALAGVDLRVSSILAVAPAAGVEVVVLPFQSARPGSLESLQASAFFGVFGRFDFSPLAE